MHQDVLTHTHTVARGVWKLVHISSNISHLSAQLLSVHLRVSLSLRLSVTVSLGVICPSVSHTRTYFHGSGSSLSSRRSSLVELLNKSTRDGDRGYRAGGGREGRDGIRYDK